MTADRPALIVICGRLFDVVPFPPACWLAVDLLEANRHALHITAHTPDDGSGIGTGIGGSFGKEFLTSEDYGPGSSVIDTLRPFRVSTFFAAGGPGGTLSAIEVTLRGESGWELTMNMTDAACE